MFAGEHHLVVLTKDIFLARPNLVPAQTDPEAPPPPSEDLLLDIPEDVAGVVVGVELDTAGAVLANQSAPQGVVAVEHQYLVEDAAEAPCGQAHLTRQLVDEG